MNIFLLCIKIFLIRIIDVTLGTIRTIYTVKEKDFIASLIGFFEVLVWFIIAKEALDSNSSLLIAIFYALGFASGTYIGGIVSKRVIKGKVLVQIITSNATNKWLDELRDNGFGVSVMDIREKENEKNKYLFFLEIDKNDFNKVHRIVKRHDKNAFIIVSESKFVINGYFRQKAK